MDPDSSDGMVDHVVDFFDRIAPLYDAWAGGQHARVATRLVDLAAPVKNEHVLDVGTGTGLVAHLVAPKVSPGMVLGIDLSENMLSIARAKKQKNVQFVGMAAEHLVFRPGTFDLVTMGEAPKILAGAGFEVERLTDMVTGGRARDAREWTELMAGAGPRPYTLIRALGPRYRDELEAEVEAAMASLGDPDDAFRYHHSYVLVLATRR